MRNQIVEDLYSIAKNAVRMRIRKQHVEDVTHDVIVDLMLYIDENDADFDAALKKLPIIVNKCLTQNKHAQTVQIPQGEDPNSFIFLDWNIISYCYTVKDEKNASGLKLLARKDLPADVRKILELMQAKCTLKQISEHMKLNQIEIKRILVNFANNSK